MPNILLVEDDEAISDYYSDLLKHSGFDVTAVNNSASALQHFEISHTDLVILDIVLGEDTEAGFHLCTEIRSLSHSVPIIFLTSLDSDIDKISGMRLGADDYITKDVSVDYLVVRIKALLRRNDVLSGKATGEQINELKRGNLHINMDTLSAKWKNQPVDLNLTQLWMVHVLASNRGYVRTPQQLMKAANITVQAGTIVVHIRNIRKLFKVVDPDFDSIKTERGIGYRWVNNVQH